MGQPNEIGKMGECGMEEAESFGKLGEGPAGEPNEIEMLERGKRELNHRHREKMGERGKR